MFAFCIELENMRSTSPWMALFALPTPYVYGDPSGNVTLVGHCTRENEHNESNYGHLHEYNIANISKATRRQSILLVCFTINNWTIHTIEVNE